MTTKFKYALGQRLFQVDTYLDISSDVTILTKINGKSVLGYTNPFNEVNNWHIWNNIFFYSLKENHPRSKKVKTNTKDIVNEPKANTRDGETNETKVNTRDEETNETNANTKDGKTNEAPLVIDKVLESNVSNQDAQESPNASTSSEEEKNGMALDQFHKVNVVSLDIVTAQQQPQPQQQNNHNCSWVLSQPNKTTTPTTKQP